MAPTYYGMVRTAKFIIFLAIFSTQFPLSLQRANTASRRINYTGRDTRVAFKCLRRLRQSKLVNQLDNFSSRSYPISITHARVWPELY